MPQHIKETKFERRNAEYFALKAIKANGKNKFLVVLEKSRYISDALQYGFSFDDLRKSGLNLATM
jgi:hypothetical protein